MAIRKVMLFLLAFYFSSGFYLARILPSDNKGVAGAKLNHVDGDRIKGVMIKNGHGETHFGGKGVNGGEDGRSRSSNFIPVYAANAHHKQHRASACTHNTGYLAFAALFLACL